MRKSDLSSTQKRIRELIWEMACSAADRNISPYIVPEYEEFLSLGATITKLHDIDIIFTYQPLEDQIAFMFFMYYAYPYTV